MANRRPSRVARCRSSRLSIGTSVAQIPHQVAKTTTSDGPPVPRTGSEGPSCPVSPMRDKWRPRFRFCAFASRGETAHKTSTRGGAISHSSLGLGGAAIWHVLWFMEPPSLSTGKLSADFGWKSWRLESIPQGCGIQSVGYQWPCCPRVGSLASIDRTLPNSRPSVLSTLFGFSCGYGGVGLD